MSGFATLPELLGEFADRNGDPAIMVDRGDGFATWSFAALADHARRLAAGLLAAGVAHQEPIAIWASNCAEWIVAYFGIVAAGATAVPLDHLADDSELAAMLVQSACRRLFTTRRRLARLPPQPANASRTVYLLDAEGGPANGAIGWKDLLAERPGALPQLRPDERASLLFTSGTTGTPKAVPLTHANFVANLQALLDARIVDSEARVLLPLPLHHTYPFTVGMLGALATGATLVLPSGMTGPQILRAIRAARASVIIGVPGLYAALVNGIEARIAQRGKQVLRAYAWLLALSIRVRRAFGFRIGRLLFRRLHAEFGGELRILSSGGAKLDPELAWKLEGLGWQVLSGYGLTETAPILTFNAPARVRIDSEGSPLAGVELCVESDRPDAPGEIRARGPNVFGGYLDDPAATTAAFTESGWFRTGDLGFLDADGYLHVVGRANETIILPDGKKLFPEDVEAAYAGMPFVKEMAVLLHDDSLVALIVPEPDAIRARGAIRLESLLREGLESRSARLKPHERVTGYGISREPLPRTHLGKVKRHKLPAIYRSAKTGGETARAPTLSEADRRMLEAPGVRRIWDWLVARYPDRPLTLDTSPQLDLGVDSLQWIELTMEIQDRFGVHLTEAGIARVMTLRDLLNEIALAAAGPAEPGGRAAAPTEEQLRWLTPPGPGHRTLGLLLYAVNRLVMHFLFRLDVRGRANIPADGRLVFAPNHASFLDPLALAAAFTWKELGRTHWAGWTGVLFTGWLMRAVSRAANVLPVDPDRDPGAALALAAAVLQRDLRLVWFPEGRRSPTGDLLEFLPGVGLLVHETGARAVPVRIVGSFAAWPSTRRFPRPRRLSVVFGQPLAADELAARGQGKDVNTRIASALRAAVAALEQP